MGSLSRFDETDVDLTGQVKSSPVLDACRSVLRDHDIIRIPTRDEMRVRETSRLRILDAMLNDSD